MYQRKLICSFQLSFSFGIITLFKIVRFYHFPSSKKKITVYSEATLVFGSFCEGRAQQITTSGVIAMEKVRVSKL